ncbi:MAG: hypothetical protein Q9M28_05990 [Mariprofundaceae bacterium]|nr:hypothetical protein [Mariprofundaceae bacterium]
MIDMSQLYNHLDYSAALGNFNHSIHERRWLGFRDIHLKVAKYKCPICECSLKQNELLTRSSKDGVTQIKATIDHYRPKDDSLYPRLVYEHTNYLLMCSDCNNAYKGNLFPLHSSTPQRAVSLIDIDAEKPLIVNPITDNLLALFTLVFRYTRSGKKVLELIARSDDAYLKEKAEETIKVFSLGDCEINVHQNRNVQICRINLLNDHFKKFYGFIEARKNKDNGKAIAEIRKYRLRDYGFYEFIIKEQYQNLI